MDYQTFPNWFSSVTGFFEHTPKVPLRALQIGVYTGDATDWLLKNRNVERLHDVDTWQGSQEVAHQTIDFEEVERYYTARFINAPIIKCKMTSNEFFVRNKDTFNFIYIDGSHTASQTAIDGLNAFDVLESRGVMAFDDYLWDHGGESFLEPRKGIDAFLSICEGKYEPIVHGYQVWIRKT